MRLSIGIDVAKELHWAVATDDLGRVRLERSVANRPADIARFLEELAALGGERTVGIDVLGGIASLLIAMLLAAGERVVHVSGLSVNRARQGTVGGEHKSDPKDARVIADQVRTRSDLREIGPEEAATVDLRLLVGRRRDLVGEQTRRLSRLHDLLVTIHPGLERRLDLTTKGALFLVTRYVTPAEIRSAGRGRLLRFLSTCKHLREREALAECALQAAREQPFALPGEPTAAKVCRELAREALAARERLDALDREIEEALVHHPDAALIRSLPGRGARSRPSSWSRWAHSRASTAPTPWRAQPGSLPCCANRARCASCAVPPGATRPSSASSTRAPSARSVSPPAARSTTASGARANAITRPSSPSHAAE